MGFLDRLSRFSEAVRPGGDLIELLKLMKKANGTELRITPGLAPQAVVEGRPLTLSEFTLEAEDCKKMCYILFTDKNKAEFEKNKKVEFVFGIKGIGRFKANIVSAEGRVSGAFTALEPS